MPVNSIKGAIGHTLGAAGAFEAVLCVGVLDAGSSRPRPDSSSSTRPARDSTSCTASRGERDVRVAISTSSGFAGANAALVLGRA